MRRAARHQFLSYGRTEWKQPGAEDILCGSVGGDSVVERRESGTVSGGRGGGSVGTGDVPPPRRRRGAASTSSGQALATAGKMTIATRAALLLADGPSQFGDDFLPGFDG